TEKEKGDLARRKASLRIVWRIGEPLASALWDARERRGGKRDGLEVDVDVCRQLRRVRDECNEAALVSVVEAVVLHGIIVAADRRLVGLGGVARRQALPLRAQLTGCTGRDDGAVAAEHLRTIRGARWRRASVAAILREDDAARACGAE